MDHKIENFFEGNKSYLVCPVTSLHLQPSPPVIMFSAVFRQQARLSLRIAARAAVPASRTLSSLALRQALVAPAVSKLATRAFSSAKVLAFERERDTTPATPSDSIYIGNMPWDMTKEDLTELFSEFGEIVSVRIRMSNTFFSPFVAYSLPY